MASLVFGEVHGARVRCHEVCPALHHPEFKRTCFHPLGSCRLSFTHGET